MSEEGTMTYEQYLAEFADTLENNLDGIFVRAQDKSGKWVTTKLGDLPTAQALAKVAKWLREGHRIVYVRRDVSEAK